MAAHPKCSISNPNLPRKHLDKHGSRSLAGLEGTARAFQNRNGTDWELLVQVWVVRLAWLWAVPMARQWA